MGSQTTKFKFNLFSNDDPFNVEDLNYNFYGVLEKIGYFPVESGTIDSEFEARYLEGFRTGTTTWRYKKFVDGTVELNTKFDLSTGIDKDSDRPNIIYTVNNLYRSTLITVEMPFELYEINNISVDVSGNTYNSNETSVELFKWASFFASGIYDLKNDIRFNILSNKKMLSTYLDYTAVSIEVKGVEL